MAWLAASYRSEKLEADARQVALRGEGIGAAEAGKALRQARQARTLQPDSGPKLLEWLLLHLRNRDREAEILATEIARDEPENPYPWFLLAEHARDPALRRQALRRIRELRPPAPARR